MAGRLLAESSLTYLVHELRHVVHEAVNHHPDARRHRVVLRHLVPRERLPCRSRHAASTMSTREREEAASGGEVRVLDIRILIPYTSNLLLRVRNAHFCSVFAAFTDGGITLPLTVMRNNHNTNS